jgi:hypothetical protein
MSMMNQNVPHDLGTSKGGTSQSQHALTAAYAVAGTSALPINQFGAPPAETPGRGPGLGGSGFVPGVARKGYKCLVVTCPRSDTSRGMATGSARTVALLRGGARHVVSWSHREIPGSGPRWRRGLARINPRRRPGPFRPRPATPPARWRRADVAIFLDIVPNLCAAAGRSLTRAEWDRYAPPGAVYQKGCP